MNNYRYSFSVKRANNKLLCEGNLATGEVLSRQDLDFFNSNNIKGIMIPKVKSATLVEYVAPIGTFLVDYLQSGISKHTFFILIAQVVDIIKKIEIYNLNIDNLVFDLKYSFFDESKQDVYMIYRPVQNNTNTVNVLSFLYDIIYLTRFNSEQDRLSAMDFDSFLKQLDMFSVSAVEKYISYNYPNLYMDINPNYNVPNNATNINYNAGSTATGIDTNRSVIDNSSNHNVSSDTNMSGNISSLGASAAVPGIAANPAYYDNKFDNSVNQQEPNTTVLDEETSMLYEDTRGTTILEDKTPKCPYLIRLNTYDRADINKQVFKIGREKNIVDFCISDNTAVSHMHAQIVTRNGKYYIRDNNSTNHTFVNGHVVQKNAEIELSNGDAIMLANEPFEFYFDK